MKNQVDYFEKCIKILKDLKKEYPEVSLNKHYVLASDGQDFNLTDKELYYTLSKYKEELDINIVFDLDVDKIITETDELFKEKDYEYPSDPIEEDEGYE